jgi:hypothetical protein
MALLEYHWKENARDDESEKLQPDILYQLKISNLESEDTFCMLSTAVSQDGQPVFLLVGLQISAGENYPVKVNGLHDIILAYPEVMKLLVFVTPLDEKLNINTQQNKPFKLFQVSSL